MGATGGVTPFTQLSAGMVFASVPMVVVLLVLQRHILSGLAAGGMKG